MTSPEQLIKTISIRVNGTTHDLSVRNSWSLLDIIRDNLGLTGTKKGCDEGVCGACTVIVNGKAIVSCLALGVEVDGEDILTIEGLAKGEKLDPIQQAFIDSDGMQCGFCTSGQIMSAKAFLEKNPHPTDSEVSEALSGNMCRCGCYNKIVEAILVVAKTWSR